MPTTPPTSDGDDLEAARAAGDEIRIGLSGWDYPGWRGDFYPVELPARARLDYVGQHFDTVELNGSFYSLQRPTSYQRWYDATPPSFLFALKGGRFITHLKRLRDARQGMANFFASGPLALKEKLGPVLWQLPASLTFDHALIADFLELLPRTTTQVGELARQHGDQLAGRSHLEVDAERPVQHALEVRHASYDDERFYQLLADHDVACVVSDSPTWPIFERRTAGHTYVRLHGHTELYTSGYGDRSLDVWAEKCRGWSQDGPVFVYFDNDARGRAPHDALALKARLAPATTQA